MSTLGNIILVVAITFGTPALAKKGNSGITITRSQTVTTKTTQGSVDIGRRTYLYGQGHTFQPSSTGGNTNPYNQDRTTYGVGIGWRF